MRTPARILIQLLIIIIVTIFSQELFAGTPPDPGGSPTGGGPPVGGGAPIDNGTHVLLIIGFAYLVYKIIDLKTQIFRSKN